MSNEKAARAFRGALIGVGVVVLWYYMGPWALLAYAAGVIGWGIAWLWK
jgi:hypothetical protein